MTPYKVFWKTIKKGIKDAEFYADYKALVKYKKAKKGLPKKVTQKT